MSEPITSYVEKTVSYGGADARDPVGNEMLVFLDDGTFGNPPGTPMMIDFRCPCGCNQKCPTHLITTERSSDRHWGFSRGPNGITLTPSIRYLNGCKTHFNVTDGRAIIHGDSGK